jgi:hypothetical protein
MLQITKNRNLQTVANKGPKEDGWLGFAFKPKKRDELPIDSVYESW